MDAVADLPESMVETPDSPRAAPPTTLRRLAKNWSVRIGGGVLVLLGLMCLAAPWLTTTDPRMIDPVNRDLLPGASARIVPFEGKPFQHTFLMGTDGYGRDIYSRVLYGGRVSLVVGASVASLSVLIGVFFGLATGAARWVEGIVMRVTDG